MKILPVGTEAFHEDGRTDRHHEAESRFSQLYECAWNFFGKKKKLVACVPTAAACFIWREQHEIQRDNMETARNIELW